MRRFTFPLPVRAYELGPRSVATPAAIARWLEHLRWEAARPDASNMVSLFQNGGRTVVRKQRIWFERPIGWEQGLVGEVWLQRIGRSSFDLGQIIREDDGGAIRVAALITGVYLGPSNRPEPLPDFLRAHEAPDPSTADRVAAALDDTFSADVPSDAAEHRIEVLPSHLDLLEHVNQARYVEWLDDVRVMVRSGSEARRRALEDEILREVVLVYDSEIRLNETAVIRAWPGSPTKTEYRMNVGASLACAARSRIQGRSPDSKE